MKFKPKEVFVNLPVVHLFDNEDEIARLASSFNTFLHGKVRLKYEMLGSLNSQFVGLFYLQRNNESQQLRDEFMVLIEQSEQREHNREQFLEKKGLSLAEMQYNDTPLLAFDDTEDEDIVMMGDTAGDE